MFEIILTVIFYILFYGYLANKNNKEKTNPKTSFVQEFKRMLEQDMLEQDMVEEDMLEQDMVEPSLFEEEIKPQPQFIEPIQMDSNDITDSLYDDIILSVDRTLSKENMKDVRSIINNKSLRKNILIAEILSKPKSLR